VLADGHVWTELLAQVLEEAPHCLEAACRLECRVHRGGATIEHVDPSQDHPFGALRTVSVDTLMTTRRALLVGELAAWLRRTHPRPTVILAGQ